MAYTLSGQQRAWASLSRDSKVQWVPKSLECLHEAPANWQPWLNEFGWSDKLDPTSVVCVPLDDQDPSAAEVFKECCIAFRDELWMREVLRVHQLSLEPVTCKLKREPGVVPAKAVKTEPQSPMSSATGSPMAKAVKKEPQVYPTGREVSKCLLRNLPFRAMRAGMLDLGQVLRGCLAVLRHFHGNSWPEHLALVSCGDLGSWHGQKADTICGVLCSETHWAFLFVFEGQGIVYDGKSDPVCFNQAAAFCQHLSDAGRSVSREVLAARCPKQVDGFSCGQRVIASLDAVLSHVASSGMAPRELHASTLFSGHVKVLLEGALEAMHQSPPKRKACKAELENGAASMKAPSTPKRARPRNDNDDNVDGFMTPPRPSRAKMAALATSPASSASTPRAIVAKTSVTSKAKIAANGSAQKNKKEAALKAAALVQKGQGLCDALGFQHKHFQSEHKRVAEGQEKGHWKVFLQALAAPDEKCRPLTCTSCCSLRNRLLQQAAPEPDVPAGSQPQASLSSAIVPVQAATLGPQVHKRGRPSKSESVDARWRLGVFIQQHRPGIYRQTAKSWGPDAVYFCVACDKPIKFKTQTCKQKVDKHERGGIHLRGLDRLGLPRPHQAPAQQEEDSAEEAEAPAASEAQGQLVPAVQDVQEYCCRGVPVDDSTLPLHSFRHSLQAFVQAGQPRTIYAEGKEVDPLQDAIFDNALEGLYVRSRQCKGPCRKVDKVCISCMTLGRGKKFREAICKKAYLIDLAMYAHRVFHSSPEELEAFEQEMRSRDYRVLDLAGSDFESLRSLPSKLAQVGKIRQRFNCWPAWRYSPAFQEFKKQWLPNTDLHHATDLQASAHASLVSALGQAVVAGKVRALDLEIASKIATGSLRSDALVDGLVTTFVQTLQGSLVNKRRHNSSEWMNQDALVDAMHTLGHGPEAESILSRFRVNHRSLPKSSFSHSSMPDTFMSMRDRAVLAKTFQSVQSFLKAASQRLHIVFDETTWSPGFQQARSFRDGQDKILGGAWDPAGDEDWSCVCPQQHQLSTLPKERMARTSLHFVAHRPQSNKFVFECCCLPTRAVISCSQTMLQLLSQFLDIVTEANAGVPPNSCSFDGCTANSRILRLFLGLLPRDEWQHLDFFKHCEVQFPPYRYWPYGHLRFRGEVLVAFHGSFHLQKRFSLQFMSGGRKVRLGDLFVDLASELSQDLPARAFMCHDVQSDTEAVMRLSPPFLDRTWPNSAWTDSSFASFRNKWFAGVLQSRNG